MVKITTAIYRFKKLNDYYDINRMRAEMTK